MCVCVCVCVCIYIYAPIYIGIYICPMYIYASLYICPYIYRGIYRRRHTHTHTHTRREQLQIIPYDLIEVYVCEEGRDIDVNTGVKMRVKPE